MPSSLQLKGPVALPQRNVANCCSISCSPGVSISSVHTCLRLRACVSMHKHPFRFIFEKSVNFWVCRLFSASTDSAVARQFSLRKTGRQTLPNATVECTQCVSDQGEQTGVDTNHMEKVTVYLILCIRALAAHNLSPPTRSAPSFSSRWPRLCQHISPQDVKSEAKRAD